MSLGAYAESIKVQMQPKSESKISGDITLTQVGEKVQIKTDLKGFSPNSKHGFHVHETGDCSDAQAKKAGGHFNPTNHNHGQAHSKSSHLGDLGNLRSDKDGKINSTQSFSGLTLNKGKMNSIISRSLIIHSAADDLKSQPSGNAGARIACGVIGAK